MIDIRWLLHFVISYGCSARYCRFSMHPTTYNRLIEALNARYAPHGLHLYTRNGHTYPFVVLHTDPTVSLTDILSQDPPHTIQTRDALAIYNAQTVADIRAAGGTLYNGTTFAFQRLEGTPPRLHATLGRYFDHLSTCVALENEFIAGGSVLRDQLHAAIRPADMTTCGAGRSAALGVSVLTAYRASDGYRALVVERSGKTAHMPNALHVLPAFQFQPSGDDYPAAEWDVARQVKREYAEELFDVPEDADAQASPAVQRLEAMLAGGAAEIRYSGIVFNPMTTHLSVCVLLLIHDPDWHTALDSRPTWETRTRYRLPVTNDAALLDALPPDAQYRFAPSGAAALWLGMDQLQAE